MLFEKVTYSSLPLKDVFVNWYFGMNNAQSTIVQPFCADYIGLIIMAEIHKVFVRITNREDPDESAPSETV